MHEGDRINNYLLEARLGAGSFGEVWRARHHVFGDLVAIKIPTDTEYVRNLQREGVAVHGLRHPNIVRAIDLDPYGDPPYFIMELVDGPTLRAVIDDVGPAFPIPAVVRITRGILKALVAAHDGGLIHRDVKPANILLDHPLDAMESVGEQAVKITDFGLGQVGGTTTKSIMQSGSVLTEDGRSIAGTLAYMSPEQKEGDELDARSDLYSCGLVLFEMLTGERPQGSEKPSSLRSEVPVQLDEVFRRCYARRDRRYASAREMLAALSPPRMESEWGSDSSVEHGSSAERGSSVERGSPVEIGRLVDADPSEEGGPFVAAGSSAKEGPPPLPKRSASTASLSADRQWCPYCTKVLVKRDDRFCISCGEQLARCPVCEGCVHRQDRFCIHCGKDLQVLA